VVRVGAWSVPAVALAVAAPAAAAGSTPTPTLAFVANGSGVRSNNGGLYWYYEFAPGSGILATGADIPASGLTMVVTFAPDPGFSYAGLSSYGAPANWHGDPVGQVTESIVYTYILSVPTGSTAVLGPGGFFAMAGNPNFQQGAFVFTISAPGFTPAVVTVPCPTPG
jgi:hypothetical protein